MIRVMAFLAVVFPATTVTAQAHNGHQMSLPDHPDMQHESHDVSVTHGHSDMIGVQHRAEQQPVVSGTRDPHAYSAGLPTEDRFHDQGHHLSLADDHHFWSVLSDRFERYSGDGNWDMDLMAWYGETFNRLGLTLDAHASDEGLETATAQAFWNRAQTAFFDSQLGVRVDRHVGGKNRQWLAAGFQGLAPNWFEVSVTAYLGKSGDLAFRGEGEYDLRLSRRVYLQPRLSVDWYSQSDEVNRLGEGLAELAAGLRLRYEFTPRFAPYFGVSWNRSYGQTSELLSRLGEDDESSHWVMGLRFWL